MVAKGAQRFNSLRPMRLPPLRPPAFNSSVQAMATRSKTTSQGVTGIAVETGRSLVLPKVFWNDQPELGAT